MERAASSCGDLHIGLCKIVGETSVPTNLAIDDRLIEEARELGHHRTKKEAVNAALDEYVRYRKQLKILDLVGKIEYYDDYDYKQARRKR
jgi:hypothetical protein